jgi:hypothetical protein
VVGCGVHVRVERVGRVRKGRDGLRVLLDGERRVGASVRDDGWVVRLEGRVLVGQVELDRAEREVLCILRGSVRLADLGHVC